MEREAEGSKLLAVVYSIPGDHPLARSPPRVTWLDQRPSGSPATQGDFMGSRSSVSGAGDRD